MFSLSLKWNVNLTSKILSAADSKWRKSLILREILNINIAVNSLKSLNDHFYNMLYVCFYIFIHSLVKCVVFSSFWDVFPVYKNGDILSIKKM